MPHHLGPGLIRADTPTPTARAWRCSKAAFPRVARPDQGRAQAMPLPTPPHSCASLPYPLPHCPISPPYPLPHCLISPYPLPRSIISPPYPLPLRLSLCVQDAQPRLTPARPPPLPPRVCSPQARRRRPAPLPAPSCRRLCGGGNLAATAARGLGGATRPRRRAAAGRRRDCHGGGDGCPAGPARGTLDVRSACNSDIWEGTSAPVVLKPSLPAVASAKRFGDLLRQLIETHPNGKFRKSEDIPRPFQFSSILFGHETT